MGSTASRTRRGTGTVRSLAIAALVFCGATVAAGQVNLVANGEFEDPVVIDYSIMPTLPHWESSEDAFEIWEEAFLGSPALGSDGQATGQHMEMDVNDFPVLSQTVTVPLLENPQATFRFDAWLRSAGNSQCRVTGSESGVLLALTPIQCNGFSWTENLFSFEVQSGEQLSIDFVQGTNSGASGAHVDQVELWVEAAAPFIVEIDLVEGGAQLSWFGETDLYYRIDTAPEWNGPWTPQVQLFAGSGVLLYSPFYPIDTHHRFFRVRRGTASMLP